MSYIKFNFYEFKLKNYFNNHFLIYYLFKFIIYYNFFIIIHSIKKSSNNKNINKQIKLNIILLNYYVYCV